MSKEESCCSICHIVDKYLDYIKVCETDEELEFCLRKVVNKAFDKGYKTFLLENISENIQFLEYLEEKEAEEDEEVKPSLRIVNNTKLN